LNVKALIGAQYGSVYELNGRKLLEVTINQDLDEKMGGIYLIVQ